MPQYLRLYLNHPPGLRAYLVLRSGRRWVRLFLCERAAVITLPRPEADLIFKSARPIEFKPTRLARRIKAVAKAYHAEDRAGVREALALLRKPPSAGDQAAELGAAVGIDH